MKKYTTQCQVCGRVSKSNKPLTNKGLETLKINEYLYKICDDRDCQSKASEQSKEHDKMMFLDKEGYMSHLILQNIASIGIIAGQMISEGCFFPEEPSTLHDEIIRLAQEFETLYPNTDVDFDYTSAIEKFSKERLLEYYGIS